MSIYPYPEYMSTLYYTYPVRVGYVDISHFSTHDWTIMACVAKTHRLVHVCNCCGTVDYYGVKVHRAIECTQQFRTIHTTQHGTNTESA
jgi:hypothetical protein